MDLVKMLIDGSVIGGIFGLFLFFLFRKAGPVDRWTNQQEDYIEHSKQTQDRLATVLEEMPGAIDAKFSARKAEHDAQDIAHAEQCACLKTLGEGQEEITRRLDTYARGIRRMIELGDVCIPKFLEGDKAVDSAWERVKAACREKQTNQS